MLSSLRSSRLDVADQALPVECAVEGELDAAVARRLAQACGLHVLRLHGRQGKPRLLRRLSNYNDAARHTGWIVLIDLDRDFDCVAEARHAWLPNANNQMCFRIARRAVEAWLLADRRGIAKRLGLSVDLIPKDPDNELDPKETMLTLARRSSSRLVREGWLPQANSGRREGPVYTSDLAEFVRDRWDLVTASGHSQSLNKAIRGFQRLTEVLRTA